jgi:NADH-quinone oxidoreductase subunit G
VSPHDALGSNLIVQTKHDKVMRVLPLENDDINECWLSDKERFSYQGLNSADRLTKPMVKQGGEWKEVDWNVALDYAAHALRDVAKNHGGSAIGGLLSPHSTLEEMFLAQKLLRGLGSENVDFRLRHSDFSADGKRVGIPSLGMKISDISRLDRVLVVGSFLRKDHPLIAQRLRQSAKKGAEINLLHSADDDLLIKLAGRVIAAPSQLPEVLGQVAKAVCALKSATVPPFLAEIVVSPQAQAIAQSLASGGNVGVLLGNFAQQHPRAASLHALGRLISKVLGAKLGFLGEAANSVGGYVAKAVPGAGGLNAAAMLADPRQAYVVLGAEPELDCADGAQALAALRKAAVTVVLTPFKSQAMLDYAAVLLPVTPFTETSGTFVNTEGRVQSFYAATKPLGESRPAWKVLRVLGNLLDQGGFDYNSSEDVRADALAGKPEFVAGLDNGIDGVVMKLATASAGIERVTDVPIHFADPLVRRSPALQKAADSAAPGARMNPAMLARLGVAAGTNVRVGAGGTAIVLPAQLEAGLPDGVVRVAAAHASTVALGAMFADLTVEKA